MQTCRDSSGPALYLEGGKRWLVGINGGFSENGQQSWFTATANYYDWITSRLAELNARKDPCAHAKAHWALLVESRFLRPE